MSVHTTPEGVPLVMSERVICQWHFEGSGFVAVISCGPQSTSEKLDAIQRMIELKRNEIARSCAE